MKPAAGSTLLSYIVPPRHYTTCSKPAKDFQQEAPSNYFTLARKNHTATPQLFFHSVCNPAIRLGPVFRKSGTIRSIIISKLRGRALSENYWLLGHMIVRSHFPIRSIVLDSFLYVSTLCLDGDEGCSPTEGFFINLTTRSRKIHTSCDATRKQKEEPIHSTNRMNLILESYSNS